MKKLTAAIALAIALSAQAEEKTLEERVKALEIKAGGGTPAATGGAPIDVFFKDGIAFKSPGGELEGHIGGTLVVFAKFFFRNPERVSADTFILRQARIVIEGKLFKDWEFRVQPTASSNGQFVLDDGYLGFVHQPWMKARVGQFKAPYGLEQLQLDAYTDFPERSVADRMTPGREIGAMVYSDYEKVLGYYLMVSNGSGRAASDDNSNKDLTARIWTRPLANTDSPWSKGVHLGFAGTWGQENKGFGVQPYTYSSLMTGTTFATSGAGAAGIRFNHHRFRGALELAWLAGPFKIQSELMVARNDFTDYGADRQHRVARLQAGYVLASLFVTGEDQVWDRVRPKTPLFGKDGGFGAVMVSARWSWWRFEDDWFRSGILDENVSARSVDEFTAGVNWYPNANVRINVAYSWVNYTGSHPNPVVVSGKRFDHEDVLVIRAQVDF